MVTETTKTNISQLLDTKNKIITYLKVITSEKILIQKDIKLLRGKLNEFITKGEELLEDTSFKNKTRVRTYKNLALGLLMAIDEQTISLDMLDEALDKFERY